MTLASYSPRAKNKRAHILITVLLAVALIAFAFSFSMPTYSGTVQLACLFLAVYAIFVASRFLFVSYTYSLLRSEKEKTYFLVEEKQGRRSSLVCQLPLDRIHSIKLVKEAKKEARGRHYTFVATMSGGDYQILVAAGESGKVAIRIEADAAFLSALRAAQAEAQ